MNSTTNNFLFLDLSTSNNNNNNNNNNNSNNLAGKLTGKRPLGRPRLILE